jgi:hypothetical protein
MIHLIVWSDIGTYAADRRMARDICRMASASGYIKLAANAWLVGGPLNANEWRDSLGKDMNMVVLRVHSSWATRGWPVAADWLKGAYREF